MSYFKQIKMLTSGGKVTDSVEHVFMVLAELAHFRKAITKREIKSRNEILEALEDCSELLDIKLLQLPANVENDIKQLTLTLRTMATMIARKDGVYKLVDLSTDLNDTSKGKLLFIEQRIKGNAKMFQEGTGQQPITDTDRKKLQKTYAKEDKLPDRIAQAFAVIDYPIVPVFEDFNLSNDKALRHAGFDYDRIAESFVVLKNQKLLVADLPKLQEMFGQGKKRVDVVQLMIDMVASINKSSQIKYELMSTTLISNPKNANLKLAWLIPADKLRSLARMGRTTRLQNWSLPRQQSSSL